jgi:hypothetical protein
MTDKFLVTIGRFEHTLSYPPVKKTISITGKITMSDIELNDDGEGRLHNRDLCYGKVNYVTGVFEIWAGTSVGETIKVKYDRADSGPIHGSSEEKNQGKKKSIQKTKKKYTTQKKK